jgi:hypothetical protein
VLGGRRKIIDTSEIFLAFSQIALGLAGFSAILVALSGNPAQWTRVDSFRIKNLLAFSFQAIFLALVPVLLKLFAVVDRTMWQTSLAVLCIGTLGGSLFAFIGFRRLSQPERIVLRPLFVYSVLAVLLAAALTELSVAFWRVTAAPGVFFAGLITLLAVSVYLIIRFLFARPAA